MGNYPVKVFQPDGLFSHQGNIITLAQKTFQQYFPKPGWVEHDPNEIFLI